MAHKKKAHIISKSAFDAIIFDLDGVVIDTATVHAEAWKRMFNDFFKDYASGRGISFKPFDIDAECPLFVKKKPLVDSVRNVLQSRGINLPEGQPDDTPGAETIYSLCKLKNEYFLKYMQDHGASVYPSTVELIHSLKKYGLKTAVISSSKNCAMILDAADISNMFDVRVDGVDAEIFGIKEKPAPDMLLAASGQLKVNSRRVVIASDAIPGVQAGRAGNFGFIIGVARKGGDRDALLENGADIVVEDLSEVGIHDDIEVTHTLPSALENFEDVTGMAQSKRLVIFLDYDGTLTPIAETPDSAVMSEDMRQTVIKLSLHCTTGIISGRDLKDVQDKVKIDSIIYAGSHGFDIASPEYLHMENPAGTEFLPILDKAEQALLCELGSTPGILVERKRFAIAIHYRLVDLKKIEFVEEVVDRILTKHPELRKTYGKKIFELLPDIDWHKGKALLSLLKTMKLDGKDVLPVYIGDDVTDEDAFGVLRGRGIGIVVWHEPYESAATYSLKNHEQVKEFLLKLSSFFITE